MDVNNVAGRATGSMGTEIASLEAKISDLTSNSWASFGNVFTQNVIQTVRKVAGEETNFNTYYYSVDDDGAATRVGGVKFLVDDAGDSSMAFTAFTQNGEEVSLLDMSPSGIQITGALTVLGDGVSFNSPNLEVSDESLTLASEALVPADIDQGGIILGTETSGTKKLVYELAGDTWSTNAGFNVEAGYGITVAGDMLVLNESGLNIGEDISISSTGMTLGSVVPVSITAAGIELGNDISLTVASGLNIAESVLLTSTSLTIGEDSPVVLDNTGLVVGTDISLNGDGLVTGDVSLNSGGLAIGTDIGLSINDGLTIGDSVSLTTDSLKLGTNSTTVLDDTSLQLGESMLLNQQGLFFTATSASIFFGPTNEWKISYDDTNKNLKFQFFDSATATYTTKMELKSAE
ncbi:unnamed protein product [Ectocarpus sp. 6 AP-2014]